MVKDNTINYELIIKEQSLEAIKQLEQRMKCKKHDNNEGVKE